MRLILTIVVTLVVIAVVGFALIYSGAYDVAAVTPDNPVVARLIHATSERSIEVRKAAVEVPAGYDAPDKAAAGAKAYSQTCVICHGGPGLGPSAIAAGLNPRAPNLSNARRKPDAQEDYWVVSNGIKMTAMPGFSKSMSSDDVWNVVAFLKTLPGMSSESFRQQTGISADIAPGGRVEGGLTEAGTTPDSNSSAPSDSTSSSALSVDVD